MLNLLYLTSRVELQVVDRQEVLIVVVAAVRSFVPAVQEHMGLLPLVVVQLVHMGLKRYVPGIDLPGEVGKLCVVQEDQIVLVEYQVQEHIC